MTPKRKREILDKIQRRVAAFAKYRFGSREGYFDVEVTSGDTTSCTCIHFEPDTAMRAMPRRQRYRALDSFRRGIITVTVNVYLVELAWKSLGIEDIDGCMIVDAEPSGKGIWKAVVIDHAYTPEGGSQVAKGYRFVTWTVSDQRIVGKDVRTVKTAQTKWHKAMGDEVVSVQMIEHSNFRGVSENRTIDSVLPSSHDPKAHRTVIRVAIRSEGIDSIEVTRTRLIRVSEGCWIIWDEETWFPERELMKLQGRLPLESASGFTEQEPEADVISEEDAAALAMLA